MDLVSSHTLEVLTNYHPEAARELTNLQAVLTESSLDPDLLKLCSDYFKAALRNDTWSGPEALTDLQAACLAVCEQFMVSVSATSNEQVHRLGQHLSADELYNLMYAIYLIESSQRLEMTLEATLQ
ncbi:MAG: hypothetical protein AAF438_03610 [Pseudomonadota bacterium]